MNEFKSFCNSIKKLIDESYPQMDIDGAREVIRAINEYFYTTHGDIGEIEMFGETLQYFSDFHKFWEKHHKEILACSIDQNCCEKVADSLHDIFLFTDGAAFKNVWDTCGLSDEQVCRVRFLTANQDFRGSRNFSDLALVFEQDNSIYDENNIKNNPEDFLREINVGSLSQNDKRINYAKNIAEFLTSHNCSPYDLIDKFNRDIFTLRNELISCNAGYGNKKADMFVRDMVVLGIWNNVSGFDKINVASDVNTIKVALRTGIIKTKIPLVTSFLDIFCYQYSYIDDMNALAWRKVWEIWNNKYPNETLESPCLLDYFVYNVIGRQFCKNSLYYFRGHNCNHEFTWHSGRNKTCQICYSQKKTGQKASVLKRVKPCSDADGYKAIIMTDYNKNIPDNKKIKQCPFVEICAKNRSLMPPKSISILGQTGWHSAYSIKGQGGGGLMA